MSRLWRSMGWLLLCGSVLTLSCSSDDDSDGEGAAASAGTGGASGTGGTAAGGATGGNAGSAAGGNAGEAGSGATAGSSGTGGTPSDAGPDGSAGAAGTPADGGLDAAPDAPAQARLILVFDEAWTVTQSEEGKVSASCWHVDASGVKQPDPGDLVIASPAPAVALSPGVFAFPDAGVYDVTCSSASLSMTVTEPAIVSYEGFDHRYVRAINAASEGHRLIEAIIEANHTGDADAFDAAVDSLEAVVPKIPNLGSVPMLVDNPNGWPTDQDLIDEGFTPGSNDSAWVAALQDLRSALSAERIVLETLTDPPTDAQAQALSDAYALTRSRLQSFEALTPSELAVWQNVTGVSSLLYELSETSRTRFTVLAGLFRSDPPSASPTSLRFSLIGTLASIAIQETLGSYTYSSILKGVGKVIVANVISIAIKDLLNSGFVPGAHAPAIDSVHGSAAGFVVPGNGFQVVGSFNPDYTKSRIVFIPPSLSNDLATIVDFVDGINGLTQEGNVLKLINGIRNLMDNLVTLFGAASSAGDQGIVLTPSDGDDFIVVYPPLPYGINCSQFSLPVAGTMIPVDFNYGRGLAINVNVIGEPESNCN